MHISMLEDPSPVAGRELIGRDAELAVLAGLLDPAADPAGSVLVVGGGGGIGKSALVDAFARQVATRALVLRTEGIPSESEIPYAGLHRLLGAVLPHSPPMPAPQRAALHTAVGMCDGPRPDRLLIGLATLTVLTGAAAERPVLCVVDDAHWLDPESLGAIAFTARRLIGAGVAVVLVERDDAALDELADLPHLSVAGLEPEAARRVLGQVYAEPIDATVASELVPAVAGNPMALHELAGACEDVDRLVRHVVQPAPVPTGPRTRRRAGRRLAGLAPDVIDLLVVVAADDAIDPQTALTAADLLGVRPQAIDEAEAAGVVEVRGDVVAFADPLVRSTCYWSAGPHVRRRVHHVLAGLVDPGPDLERHAWHRALATLEPDEEVASTLARAARRAGDRGAAHAQVELLLRAAELSPDPDAGLRRHIAAAGAAGTIPDHGRLARLVAWARATTSDPRLLTEVRRVEALAPTYRWRYGRAPEGLIRAALALDGHDRARARRVALEALEVLTVAAPHVDGVAPHELARVVRALPREGRSDDAGVLDLLLDGYADVILDGWAAGAPSLKEALRRWSSGPGPTGPTGHLGLPLRPAFPLWDHDRLPLPRLPDGARRGVHDRFALLHRARLEVARGQLDAADRTAAAIGVASDALDGHPGWQLIGSIEAMAWRGLHDDTHRAALVLQLLADDQHLGYAEDLAQLALAVLANGAQRYGEAATAARRAARGRISEVGSQALVELAEALAHLGEARELDAVLAEIDVRATASGSALALGLSARSHALASRGADADDLFRRAVELLSTTSCGPELARAHLAHGEWLRRARRPTDARHHLREAHEALVRVGATSFAARARAELHAAGEGAARPVSASRALTTQELRVARLARDGQTNKEIATQLYLSASTIDFHLRKVYRKLGIASRRQLAGVELG